MLSFGWNSVFEKIRIRAHWTSENSALPVWPVRSEDIVATVVNRRFQFWYHFCPRPPSQSWWSWGLWFFGLLWKKSWVRGIHYCAPKLVCLYKRKEACQISTPSIHLTEKNYFLTKKIVRDLILEAEDVGPEQNGYKNWNRACTTVTTVFSEVVGHNVSAEFFVVQCDLAAS